MTTSSQSLPPTISLLAHWSEPSSLGMLFHDDGSFLATIDSASVPLESAFATSRFGWTSLFLALGAVYLLSEVLFYLYFCWHLLPQANRLNVNNSTTGEPVETYHDYPLIHDRVKLVKRILNRLEQKAKRQAKRECTCPTETFQSVVQDFILAWFECGNATKSVPDKTGSTDRLTPFSSTDPLMVAQQLGIALAIASEKKQPISSSDAAEASLPSKPPMLTVMSSSMSTSTRSNSIGSSNSTNSISSSSAASSSSLAGGEECLSDPEDNAGAASAPQSSSSRHAPWTIPGLHYKAMYDFFAWAFFGKDSKSLTIPEQAALQECFQCVREETGLVFFSNEYVLEKKTRRRKKQNSNNYQPRRLSLEKVNALHRPWLVYALVALGQWFTRALLLPWLGFERVGAKSTKLVAWYRPAADVSQRNDVCLFFHGIAPAGLLFYTPMIEALMGKRHQSLVLFENPSVSCQFHSLPEFSGLNEPDTVGGILEILRMLQINQPSHRLMLMGHSFGSVPITHILRRRSDFPQIQHVVLMDPVTLLLSEPTVMSRFLYSDEDAVIRFVVASELFTEFYLRRHFCWYNAGLWMEDFVGSGNDDGHQQNNPEKWTIILSGKDEIVPSDSVREYVSSLGLSEQKCNLVYWPHAKHANCVMSPRRWNLMNSLLYPKQDDDDGALKQKQS
mmetsp:Transcript_29126/g.68023  ORF Transcript_29126/g.68023 Transcript_29126/m.68023 type:complete len:675 (+) Transcript_29126:294-2318(+)